MKLRTILAAFAVMASGSLYAQNATKADLDKLTNQVNELSQRMTELESKATQFETKVAQLEADVERIVTENVNLVEQLNIKTVTSITDKAGLQWDIVKVEPIDNEVVITLRITNKSGVMRRVSNCYELACYALDSNTNLSNNKYEIDKHFAEIVENGAPINKVITIRNVPTTCTYLSLLQIAYAEMTTLKDYTIKFTGVHIPW